MRHDSNGHSTSGASTALPNTHETRAALYDQHAQWQGTPYLLGGLSQNGIDCSGFVLTTFRQQFGIDLPRTTQVQASLGKPVRQNDLQAGDLVFFRTGKRTQHVGIYVENRTFCMPPPVKASPCRSSTTPIGSPVSGARGASIRGNASRYRH
ncbi:NlpC/P60 family protein [Alkalilimnicola ehrlichii]|uniref:NlpC/P60 family protein n=1 Tax=Alkalilimnicola ehrlichii TaxID=351052 RepID=UPI00384D110C